jgi:hypothetical protein
MSRRLIGTVHGIAAATAFLTILTFWSATIISTAFLPTEAVVAVKGAILWGMVVLVPALAIAGGTGFRLGGKSRAPLIAAKRRRMPFIAANGMLVLVPAAIVLASLAAAGDFGFTFYAVEAIELAAGAVNIALMGLSIRDGLRITRRIARASPPRLA